MAVISGRGTPLPYGLTGRRGGRFCQKGERSMVWKAPKVMEVPVGMEINMYACAEQK